MMPILQTFALAAGAYAVVVPFLDFRVSETVLKPLMVLYNLLMSVFSAYCACTTAAVLHRTPLFGDDCDLLFRNQTFRDVVYWFAVSKVVEFADTFFLIVRGKGVSWLHYLHHIGACTGMAMLYDAQYEIVWDFVLLNGTIHTAMYCYYGFACLGIRLPGKSWLTTAQITQFVVGLSLLNLYGTVEPCNQGARLVCLRYMNAYVGMLVVLFGNFYFHSYIRKKR